MGVGSIQETVVQTIVVVGNRLVRFILFRRLLVKENVALRVFLMQKPQSLEGFVTSTAVGASQSVGNQGQCVESVAGQLVFGHIGRNRVDQLFEIGNGSGNGTFIQVAGLDRSNESG